MTYMLVGRGRSDTYKSLHCIVKIVAVKPDRNTCPFYKKLQCGALWIKSQSERQIKKRIIIVNVDIMNGLIENTCTQACLVVLSGQLITKNSRFQTMHKYLPPITEHQASTTVSLYKFGKLRNGPSTGYEYVPLNHLQEGFKTSQNISLQRGSAPYPKK